MAAQAEGQARRAKWQLDFGARPLAENLALFRAWAPRAARLAVRLYGGEERTVEMERRADDTFEAVVEGVAAGADYKYVIDGERERPDPVSRWQPEGVHGPSRVVDPSAYAWTDQAWRGIPLKDYVIYELHTGTFTPEGTFDSIIPKLAYLKELGVTAVELMPVAQFPGGRNWGYDGTYLYAPQSTYGGPEGLKRLIDACHGAGLAVVMDVVYNHFGPEGNYFGEYAPVFNPNYHTPWGDALNFDGAESDGVRRFFTDNALYWLTEYHVDALRLDAVHRIIDTGPRHILADIAEAFTREAERLGRAAYTIAESDLNDVRLIRPRPLCGYGLDAQWSDDFHHSLHALLTKATRGYFADFGRPADLAKAITEGFVYDGRRSAFRRKRHGTGSADRPGEQFVVCVQNHDQIANSYWGDRLGALVSPAQQKLAAALLLCAPNVPMLFMGQEWGETAPFLYFTSHTDAELARAVREGRRREYSAFVTDETATLPLADEGADAATVEDDFSDPQAEATFARSKLVWARAAESPHAEILRFYRDLLALRKSMPCLSNCDKNSTRVEYDEAGDWVVVERGDADGTAALLVCNLSGRPQTVPLSPGGDWQLALWSEDEKYGGRPGQAAPPVSSGEGATKLELPAWGAAVFAGGKQTGGRAELRDERA